jgi:glycosyltransferase involved in cell wall biosynthesis
VNDGSRDRTGDAIARIVGEAPDHFSQLDLPANRGKAEAVRTGVLWALDQTRARYVGFWDADLATPLGEAPDFADFLDRHPACQAVFGSRVMLLGRDIERSALRHYLGRLFATVASSLVLRIPVYDTQCGAKLFRASEELRAVFSEPFTSRWVFDVEILARLIGRERARASQLVYEMPLRTWHDVPGSKVRARDFLWSMLDLARIHRRRVRAARD